MLLEIDPQELRMWRAYYSMVPMKEVRADLRSGSETRATLVGAVKHPPAMDKCVLDFEVKPPKKPMQWKRIKSAFAAFTSHLPVIKMKRPHGSNKNNLNKPDSTV